MLVRVGNVSGFNTIVIHGGRAMSKAQQETRIKVGFQIIGDSHGWLDKGILEGLLVYFMSSIAHEAPYNLVRV